MRTLILLAMLFTAGCVSESKTERRIPSADTPSNPDATGPVVHPSAAPPAVVVSPKAVSYTCPMHPEVISSAPGKCPKCGMTLTPVTDGGDHDHP